MENEMFEDVKTVNSAGQSMSNNVEYVSRRQQYIIYENKRAIKTEVDDAKEIIAENPAYMDSEEINFLEKFVKSFSKAEEQGSYNLENEAYLGLYRSLLRALKSRMDQERLNLVESGDADIAPQIQHLFYLIDSAVEKEFQKVDDNWGDLIKGKTNVDASTGKVNWLIKQLVRAYKLEFDFMTKGEVERESLQRTRNRLTDEWRETYRGYTDVANA
ncbi:hypothetical protein [Candidatus Nanohalococcus occultus]|uniref:hypothetical protein n=1 Tax=Candidatus Nanohalococcus occultus TaxID=2978047 RepID=UPI0039DF6880